MDIVTLYYDLLSQPSRTLYIFLSVNKVPFKSVELNLISGEHRREEYKKINPMRKVPAIVYKNFNLSESVAIMRFLVNVIKEIKTHWYPNDSKQRAKVDEFLEFQHIGLRAPCELYFLATCFDPLIKNMPQNPHYLALLKKNLIQACDCFEETWLKNKLYICGDTITIADIFAASELEQLKLTDYDPKEGRPLLKAWMERVRKETNPYYDKAHTTLNQLALELNTKSSSTKAKY